MVKIGLVRNREIIGEKKIEARSENGLAPLLPALEEQINDLMLENGVNSADLTGIGLAFPGLVNCHSQKVLSTNKKYDDACGIDLNEWVRQKWKTSFFLDNDARMAAVGEWKSGIGQGTDNLVAITLGTGIGAAAIMEGRLLRGKHYQAGVLGGHISLNYKGQTCTCGNTGCAEAEISSWNIGDKITGDQRFSESLLAGAGRLDFETLFGAALHNDGLAIAIREECLQIWSVAIINLIHAYDPDMVVMSGGIMNSKAIIIPAIQKIVDARAWCPWGKVSVKASTLIDKAAILGVTYCLEHQL